LVKYVFIAAIAAIVARGILGLIDPSALNAPVPESPKPGTIRGYVTDRKTSEPIVGGIVIVEGTEKGVATDVQGRYTIGPLRPGTCRMTVGYVAYNSQVRTVKVDSITSRREDFRLEVTEH
jgi:hypothetical protein